MSGLILNPYGLSALSLSLVGTNTALSATVSLPGSPAALDLAIYWQFGGASGGPTLGVPSGYTQMVSQMGTSYGAQAGYKVLTGGETEIATGTSGTGLDVGTACIVYRPSRAIASLDYGTWNKEFTGGNPASQSVDPTAFAGPVLVLALAGANAGSFSFSVASPAFDATLITDITNGYANYGYKLYNTSPQSHSIDMADNGGENILASGYLSVS